LRDRKLNRRPGIHKTNNGKKMIAFTVEKMSWYVYWDWLIWSDVFNWFCVVIEGGFCLGGLSSNSINDMQLACR